MEQIVPEGYAGHEASLDMPGPSKKRPGPSSRFTRREVVRAARRYYDLGHTQAEIAKDLGVSGSYVARVLQRAREQGWVRIFIEDDRESELAAAIQERFPHIIHAEVVPSGSSPEDTARSIGMAMATWFDDLLDRDEDSPERAIHNVAIGGSMVHGQFVQRVGTRKNRISVGPTALTPTGTKVARFTSPMLAQQLALRLGAISPGDSMPPPSERQGYLYGPSRFLPPDGSLAELAAWWLQTESDPEFRAMEGFWSRIDVAFVSIVGIDWIYDDVRRRLANLGVSVDALRAAGAIAVLANQFIRPDGTAVPLADGVASYEPAIPAAHLRAVAERGTERSGEAGLVVLDLWGSRAAADPALVGSGLFNVLFCDADAVEQLLAR